LANLYAEVPGASAHVDNLGQGEYLDVGMQIHLGHLGRLDTDGAIQRRKILVQDSHNAADSRFSLHKNHASPSLGQVKRRLDTGDAAADDKD
jgi:hypothetical protein